MYDMFTYYMLNGDNVKKTVLKISLQSIHYFLTL